MSWDLSWLWQLLQQASQNIAGFFNSIWGVAQQISNVGQGLFSGLVALGSMIWDALVKAFGTIGSWIYEAYRWVANGLSWLGEQIGTKIMEGLRAVGAGFTWIASQINAFGQWIWSGILGFASWFAGVVESLWNAFVSWVSSAVSTLQSWFASVVDSVNQWFNNLIVSARNKLITIAMVDTTIMLAWHSAKRIAKAKSMRDIKMGIAGILMSPLAGYMVGHIVDAVTPRPQTRRLEIVPKVPGFTYTPTGVTVRTPAVYPTPSPAPQPHRIYPDMPEKYPEIGIDVSYELRTTEPSGYRINIGIGYETRTTEPPGQPLAIDISYETQIV